MVRGGERSRGSVIPPPSPLPLLLLLQFCLGVCWREWSSIPPPPLAPPPLPAAVVFGRVVEGMDLVDRISRLSCDATGTPLQKAVIHQCGLLGAGGGRAGGDACVRRWDACIRRWVRGEGVWGHGL